MKLTLRKARQLEQSILDRINQENKDGVRFSLYSSAPDLDSLEKGFLSELTTKTELNAIRCRIRRDIGNVNHESGLNDLITQEFVLKGNIRLYKQHALATLREQNTKEQLQNKIDSKLKSLESGERHFGGDDHMNIYFLTSENLQRIKDSMVDFKRKQQSLADEMLAINLGSKIELDSGDEEFLRALNLI